MATSEHRRFLLLSGGRSLLIGCSLNPIAKNEAVALGGGDAEDRAFFDGLWPRVIGRISGSTSAS
jgi:hypothetical protein